jgi:tRNA U34 5-methylaminomethyl-2-thiouridine-forming methyltransferase MnmC
MEIFKTADGSHSLYSEQFGVSYHSKYGAIQETEHVFIDAALRPKVLVQKEIAILDIGLGTGLNALMTCLEAIKLNLKVHYTAVEAFPISVETARQLNFAECFDDSELVHRILLQLHGCEWNKCVSIHENFTFKKLNQKFEDLSFEPQFDIVYFDAFAPTAQPELWETPVLKTMYDALLPQGVLTTYCAKGVVKRTMKAIGFQVQSIPGPPGKREMTKAIKP